MMLAENFNEFVEKSSQSIRQVLNTEMGQELTDQLLKMKLEDNPNMSVDEWNQTKSEFMTYLFFEFVKNTPEAMSELGTHLYNELNK